jgi:hypothetical protein
MTERIERHLEPHDVATYVDGGVPGAERARIEAHLAGCTECRAEVTDVSRILRTAPAASGVPRRVWIPAAVAAAVALLWVGPRAFHDQDMTDHRDEVVTTTVAPRPIAPVGSVDTVSALVWSSVSDANSYRVRLFDADGAVLWEREAADTVVPIPSSLTLRSEVLYYWRVEADTGFDRSAASDLVEFRVRRGTQ